MDKCTNLVLSSVYDKIQQVNMHKVMLIGVSMHFNRSLYYISIVVCCVAIMGVSISTAVQTIPSSSPRHITTVVIDAGHGGIDGGCTGVNTGISESELNLTYANLLKSSLERSGMQVIMTRKDMNGLYDEGSSSLKKSDMNKRREIIEQVNPDLVVSIHMNSFSSPSSKGAQVFYDIDNAASKYLSTCIQDQFVEYLPYAKKTSKAGDFYMVNCTNIASVLVECGYLSSPVEEKLLISKDYQALLIKCITYGIIEYLK